MSDESKIRVIIEGEQTVSPAASQAKNAIANLGQGTDKAAESTRLFAGQGRGLHSALHLIARESGPAAGAAVAAATALMTGGLLAAVFAVRELFQWMESLKKKAEEFRERQAAVWLAAQEGAQAARDAAQEFNDKLDDEAEKLDALKTRFENQKKLNETQIDAHKKLLEAIEKEQLEEAGGDKAKEAAIRKHFADLKQQYDFDAERQKIEVEQEQLGELQSDKFRADLRAKALEKDKENLVAQTPQLKAALDNITKEFGTPEKIKAAFDQATSLLQKGLATGGIKELPGGGLDISDASKFTQSEFVSLLSLGGAAGIRTAQQNWAKFQGAQGAVSANEAALKEIERGLGKAQAAGTSDAGQISTLTAGIAELVAELQIHRQLAERERELSILGEHGGAAGLVGAVAANERILEHGGKLSADQIATNRAFSELMEIIGSNAGQTLALVKAIADQQKTQAAVIAGLSNHAFSH